MADPITIAMAAFTVVSSIAQANSEASQIKSQGLAQKQAADQRAAIAEKEGERAVASAASEGRKTYKEGKLHESAALARGAQMGMGTSESFINYLAGNAATSRYNAQSQIYGGLSQDQAKQHEASVERWQGDTAYQQAKAQAKSVKRGGLIKGVVGGMSTLYGGGAFGGGGAATQAAAPVSRGAGLATGGYTNAPMSSFHY